MTILPMNVQTWIQMISDGYESDRAALQLMTPESDIHNSFDTARLNEGADNLNL